MQGLFLSYYVLGTQGLRCWDGILRVLVKFGKPKVENLEPVASKSKLKYQKKTGNQRTVLRTYSV